MLVVLIPSTCGRESWLYTSHQQQAECTHTMSSTLKSICLKHRSGNKRIMFLAFSTKQEYRMEDESKWQLLFFFFWKGSGLHCLFQRACRFLECVI